MPLAVIVAPANENEKKHALRLFRRVWEATDQRVKTFIADSQFSSRKLRRAFNVRGERSHSVSSKPEQKRRSFIELTTTSELTVQLRRSASKAEKRS
jgi:hypothetical protein